MQRDYVIAYDTSSAVQAAANVNALAAALQGLGQAGPQAQQAVQGIGQGAQQAQQGTGGLATSIGEVVAVSAGLAVARAAVTAMADAYSDALKHAEEVAKKTIAIRDSLREIANLQGKDAPTDDVIVGLLDLRRQTGMKQAEAKEFEEQWTGAVFTARDKGTIQPTKGTREELEQAAKEETALTAIRTGMDPKDAAVLGASILASEPIHSREEFAEKLGLTVQNLNEGQGLLGPFAKAMVRVMSSEGVGERIKSSPDTAAMLGVMSVGVGNSPLKAATHMEQAVRELYDFGGPSGEFLKEAGVKPTDDPMEALRKVHPFLEKARESGEGADFFLQEHGFHRARGRDSLAFLDRNLPVAEKRIARNHEGGAGAGFMAQNRAFLGSKAGLARGAEVQKDTGEITRGIQEELAQDALEAAAGQLEGEGQINTKETNFWDNVWDNKVGRALFGDQKRERKEARAIRNLIQGLEKTGMTEEQIDEKFPGLTGDFRKDGSVKSNPGAYSPLQGEKGFKEIVNDVTVAILERDKGGKPFGDSEEGIRLLKEISEKLGHPGGVGRPVEGRAPAAPAVRPMRAGGT